MANTDTVTNPMHTYTQTAVYTVSPTATGPGGSDALTRTNYITVSSAGTYTTTVITYT
jgi:PKD repeat protein